MNKVRIHINKNKIRKLKPTENAFLSLCTSIIFQQISTKAGDSIRGKFIALFDRKKVTPDNFLGLGPAELRSAGISPQKLKYLTDLAQKFVDGTIDHKNFHKMSDSEVKEHLLAVKGIGSWTADMFLIFALNRPDILPVGDLAIKKGFQKAFNLKSLPSESKMLSLARSHLGSRTELSLYLWDTLDSI